MCCFLTSTEQMFRSVIKVSVLKFCAGCTGCFWYRKSTLGGFFSPKMCICVRVGVLGARKYFMEPKPL